MGNRNELIEAFTTAVSVALREMAGVESSLVDSRAETGPAAPGDFNAVLQLTARTPGLLVLSMPESTARTLAERILAETAVNLDAAMVRDCTGEVANIIAGQAKTLLYGTPDHFRFSAPRTDGIEALHTEWLVLAFGSDAGELTLRVHLPE